MLTKKKKIISIILAAVSLLLIFLISHGSAPKGNLSGLSIDEDTASSLKSSRRPSESHLLNAVFFNEEQLFFDPNANAFYYSIIEEDPDWDNPRVTIQSSSFGVQAAFVRPDCSREAIAENRPLKLIAATDREYREYDVYLTTLPMINIQTEGVPKRVPGSFSMELLDNSGKTGTVYSKSFGTIHKRGHMSSKFDKYPLRFILKTSVGKNESRDAPLLGLRESNKWVLYSPYNDRDRVRNVFSTELWYRSCAQRNSFGLINSARYKYVEVFINGSYFGLYALGYMPDEYQLKTDSKPGEYSYKNMNWFDYRERDISLNTCFSVVDAYSGYGIERDEYDPYTGEGTEEEFEPLQKYCDYLNEDHSLKEQLSMVDLDAYLDFYLFQNVIQGYDSARRYKTKNYFITAKKDGDQYRYLFTPWDLDLTWGLTFTEYEMDESRNYAFGFGPFAVYFPEESEEVFQMLSLRYRELRKNEWSDQAVTAILDAFEDDIFSSGAYIRDLEIWPDSIHSKDTRNLDEFKSYVLKRLHYCDTYFGIGS